MLGSLPAALARLGDTVGVVAPRYRGVLLPRERIWDAMPVHVGPHSFTAGIDQVVRHGVRYFFVDIPALYDRAGLYYDAGGDYGDNHIRFAALCQAAIGIARHIFHPSVFHAHDWQAGLLPLYLRENFRGDPTFFKTRTVLTIHNLGYQGNFPAGALRDLGIHPALFHPEGVEFYGRLSLLKAGIIWADAITTVSPTYAREIQTPEFGFGMDGLLRSRADKLTGILNGVDYSEWNPEHDRYITAHYSARDLSCKRACKLALLQEAGLPADTGKPLLAVISRLAYQKGMDLAAAAVPWIVSQGAAVVTLGSGEGHLEAVFRGLEAAHPQSVAVNIGYDEALSHRIEAGADMFLMPSRYEPCGLNQIYSLRYGTVPVVRATGGLEDTVDEETGFKFRDYTFEACTGAISAALSAYRNPADWAERMKKGMAKDFSWEASARQYQAVYRSASRSAAEHHF